MFSIGYCFHSKLFCIKFPKVLDVFALFMLNHMPYYLLLNISALVIPDRRMLFNPFCQPKLCLSLCLFLLYWSTAILLVCICFLSLFKLFFLSNYLDSICRESLGKMKRQEDEVWSSTGFLRVIVFIFNIFLLQQQWHRVPKSHTETETLQLWKRESEMFQTYCLLLVLLNFSQRILSMYYEFWELPGNLTLKASGISLQNLTGLVKKTLGGHKQNQKPADRSSEPTRG